MIYRFTLISDEIDRFLREIQIDSDDTFYNLHKAILSSVNYTDDQMTSFFVCNEGWEKDTEITLEDMKGNSEEDNWTMRGTKLSDLVEEEKQHLLYVFDPLADRPFFIELSETMPGKSLKEPVCSRKIGDAPKQLIDFDAMMAQTPTATDMDEDFYGEGFDEEDLNNEGLGPVGEGDDYVSESPSVDEY